MKAKGESEVAQSCPTLSDPMDCSLPGSAVHRIFQARVLEWGAIAFSKNVHIDDIILSTVTEKDKISWGPTVQFLDSITDIKGLFFYNGCSQSVHIFFFLI